MERKQIRREITVPSNSSMDKATYRKFLEASFDLLNNQQYFAPDEDINSLGASDTVAVSLPGTPFGLNEKEYTPMKELITADAILALATDINPGTSWCESMQFIFALACRKMGLTPAQAIAAGTINAAAALGQQHRIGSIEVGKQADLLILDVDDYRHLGYRFGINLVSTVIKRGSLYPVR